jgi:hypothetical protein
MEERSMMPIFAAFNFGATELVILLVLVVVTLLYVFRLPLVLVLLILALLIAALFFVGRTASSTSASAEQAARIEAIAPAYPSVIRNLLAPPRDGCYDCTRGQ